MTDYRVRPATMADVDVICRIYNQGIEDRVATLETELRTPEERRQWLVTRSPRHPVIVAEATQPRRTSTSPPSDFAEHAAAIAWGSLNVFNPRDAYRFVADISVYVERDWRGRGAGSVILARLVELGREHAFHKLVLSAFPTNKSGLALYEKFGFRTVGLYREQGLLDQRWVDTIVMEKLL